MDRTPTVSVLLPAWHAQDTVAQAVRDILNQEAISLELIAIHQGGPDATLRALQDVTDPRFRLVQLQEPDTAAALEAGRALVRGEWIARIDADDRCAPTRLVEQLRYAEATGALVVPCQVEAFPAGREQLVAWQNALVHHQEMAAERFVEMPWFTATALFRAEALARVGGWRSGPFQEDYDLVVRLFAAGVRTEKLPAVRYRWQIHPGQDTWRWSRDRVRAQKAAWLDLPADAYVAGTGRSLSEWAALLGLPAVPLDPRHPELLPPGFPVLVFGAAVVRARLRAALGQRPHLFVA